MTRRRRRFVARLAAVTTVAGAAAIASAAAQVIAVSDTTIMENTMVPVGVAGSGGLRSAYFTGSGSGNFFFVGEPGCSTQSCTFEPPRVLPTAFDIGCSLFGGSGSATAILVVIGDTDADSGSGVLTCLGSADTEPSLSVTPTMITVSPPTFVGVQSGAYTITLANTGSGQIDVYRTTPGPEWEVTGCTPSCVLLPGAPVTLTVRYTPSAVGPQTSQIDVITGASESVPVTLAGSGRPTSLLILDPEAPDFLVDFGTIPLGTPATRPVQLALDAPAPVAVTLASDRPEIVVAEPAFTMVPGDRFVDVSCGSSAPGTYTGTVAVGAAVDVQGGSAFSVRCDVADTDVVLEPDRLDFGEVRIAEPPVTHELIATVRNAGSVAVPLTAVRLDGAIDGLTVEAIEPMTIAPGASVTARIALVARTEGELAGARLVVEVDGATLERPIEGRVVRAAAHLEPRTLDLGTVCAGRPVSGTVRLVNDGTARLVMASPTIDGPFTLAFDTPIAFPAELEAAATASVQVAPAVTVPGMLTGSLEWDVDAPEGPFRVDPIEVEFIADGTAISPRGLAFGRVDAGVITPERTITLENCSTVPVELAVQGVLPQTGNVQAWQVEPREETTTLDPEERYTIAVAFAPATPGVYLAHLRIAIDGVRENVELTGEALGSVPEQTSFYACSCASGSRGPAGAWPFAIALAALTRRRRRGSS